MLISVRSGWDSCHDWGASQSFRSLSCWSIQSAKRPTYIHEFFIELANVLSCVHIFEVAFLLVYCFFCESSEGSHKLTKFEEWVLAVNCLHFWEVVYSAGSSIRVLKFEREKLGDLTQEHKSKFLWVLLVRHGQVHDSLFGHEAYRVNGENLTGIGGLRCRQNIELHRWTCHFAWVALLRSALVVQLKLLWQD